MSRIQITDLSLDETLDREALDHVRGGIIAVLIGLHQGPALPTQRGMPDPGTCMPDPGTCFPSGLIK